MQMFTKENNYFNVINTLKSNMNVPMQECRAVMSRILEKKQPQNEQQGMALKFIDNVFRSVNTTKDNSPTDYKAVYDNYISLFKEKNPVEVQVTFMRFLSLYIGGSIPHYLFVRLVYRLIGKPRTDDPLISGLPAFLASIHFNSFTQPKQKFESKEEAIAAEIIISVTSAITNAEAAHSIYKCFRLLSEGYISPKITKKWLSSFCSDEALNKLDLMNDFSAFHPSRIPHEYILCADFCDSVSEKKAVENFEKNPTETRRTTPFESVAFETLENQLMSTRTLIELLARGEKPPLERLVPFFGNYSAQIVQKLPQYSPIAIKRLSVVYEEMLKNYTSFVNARLQYFHDNYIEYRVAYKSSLKNLHDPIHTHVPGVRKIKLGSNEEIGKAMELTSNFISSIFGENEMLRKGMQITNEFLNGNIFIAELPLINFSMALSELIRLVKDCEISAIPEACKTEDGLKKLFPNVEQQCVDLVLIKISRQLKKCQELTPYNFTTATNQGMFISVAHLEGGELIVETRISPFYKQSA